MKKQEQIKIIRKASANNLYDKFMIIYESNRKIRKENPNLLNEIRFHRKNYYDLIDKYNPSEGTISPKVEQYGKNDEKAKGFMET